MVAGRRCGWLPVVLCLILGLIVGPSPLRASSLNEALKPDRFTLDNGLDVWMKSRPGSGSVELIAVVKVGRRYESLRERGLAHFVEHMVFEGTKRRSRRELRQNLKARGGSSQGMTWEDATWIMADVPPGQLEFGLRWLAEVLFQATFPRDRLAIERKVILRERGPVNAGSLRWRMMRALFDGNSMVEGLRELKSELSNVEGGLKREDLVRFYHEQYVPNNVALIVVGDVDPATARAEIRQAFGAIPRGKRPGRGARSAIVGHNGAVRVAAFSGFKSSTIWCGYSIPRCSPDDFERLSWVFWLVSDRAGERIRGERGLAYDVSSYAPSMRSDPDMPSLGCVYADCRYSDLQVVERILREELGRIRREPPSPREVAMIRGQARAGWTDRGAGNQGVAYRFACWAAWPGTPPDLDRIISQMSARQLRDTARKYFRPERFFVAYYRPYKTPRQLAATGMLFLLVSALLVVWGRRRNARLAPPPEHIEAELPTRNTPRLVAARAMRTLIWGALILFVIGWLPWKLTEWLFTHAIFVVDFAAFLIYVGLVYPGLVAVGATSIARRVAVSREGMLLMMAGFHILLRPKRIASIEVRAFSPWRLILDPRTFVLGGDRERSLVVRTKGGFTISLGVREPEEFAQEAEGYLSDSGPRS